MLLRCICAKMQNSTIVLQLLILKYINVIMQQMNGDYLQTNTSTCQKTCGNIFL